MNATGKLDFDVLVASIRQVHEHMAAQAGKAVNISLTLRNWAIGCYLREYEQNGSDRAQYGEALLESLAAKLQIEGLERTSVRELRRYRQFYLVYPQIWQSATAEFRNMLPGNVLQIRESPTPESGMFRIPGKTLVTKLSFTHLVELKLEAFSHGNLGQLNTYVSWYRKNMTTDGDNPPVGLLLCTHKNHALVEYALAGMDNRLFVSKYKLELPSREFIQRFLEEKLKEVGEG